MTTKKQLFLSIFKRAQKKYSRYSKRLAGEGWKHDWQTLITTIYSAQSRDELTIPVMESTFKALPTLEAYAKAPLSKIMLLTKKINYYKTKSKNSKATAQLLIKKFKGRVPDTMESLTTLPGVGRKTANLILTEVFNKDGICIDTHCHRLLNVLNIIDTKNPYETELAMRKIAPKKYWGKINRIFVLWGKDISGRNKEKILAKLKEK
jgi:endonuclease III